jgi:hypothetical protein
MNWLLALLVVVVALLHQDFWNWTNRSLVFGFLPMGLAYHIGFSFLAALTMWALVRFAWPEHLETVVAEPAGDR